VGYASGYAILYTAMKQTMNKWSFANMLNEAARRIREQHQLLTELDSVAGDGDHGATMMRVAEQLETAISKGDPLCLGMLFKNLGWKVMGVDGGASSAILGTFFGGMGDVEISEEVDCKDLAAIFEAGLCAVSKQTKAEMGDKTMMDALVPAVSTVRSAAASGKSIACALEEAAKAARVGSEATKALIAKHGRAKYLGEKTRGYADAGATSVALLFEGFSAGMKHEVEKGGDHV
jgi:phosphoenolpyruvate---glycerone phosphotransferase subunit DhaL